jgi:hypothetical protein
MDWVEDQILPVIGTRVTGDLLTAAANDDLMDIAIPLGDRRRRVQSNHCSDTAPETGN